MRQHSILSSVQKELATERRALEDYIHGDPETAVKDRDIRSCLRKDGYDGIQIAASELYDRAIITKHFFRLGKILIGTRKAQRSFAVRQKRHWFALKEFLAIDRTKPSSTTASRSRRLIHWVTSPTHSRHGGWGWPMI